MSGESWTDGKSATFVAGFVCAAPLVVALLAAAFDLDLRDAFLGAMPLVMRYLGMLALPALALWWCARACGVRLAAATVLLLVNAIAFMVYAGIGQSAAMLLLVTVSAAIGGLLLRDGEEARQDGFAPVLIGLAVLVAAAGWLLPFPVHSISVYLAVTAVLLILAHQHVARVARVSARQWSCAVEREPAAAWLAVLVMGFAAIPSWLPSMNPDDNSAHLLLSRQLIAEAHSRLDVSSQIFVVAPWFNNVLHSSVAVLQGGEARSAIGLWWLLVGCLGAYRLADALGARGAFPWLAAALYASHPLTAYFGMTLQVDGASAALLLHLLAACVQLGRDGQAVKASPWLFGALCGALVALKVTNAIQVAVIGVWLMWRFVSDKAYLRLVAILAIAAFVAFSSYFYASVITGNPLFPLFNGIFNSPYLPAVNMGDKRWSAGIGVGSLWDMTFATSRYLEAYAGAAGLSLVALCGTWLVSLRKGWSGALVLFAFATGLAIFFQVQYLRYVFPVLAVLGTVGVVAFSRLPLRIGAAALILLVFAQCGLIRTPSWILTAGVAERLMQEGPKALPEIERTFVPERALLRRLDDSGQGYCLLLAEPLTSYAALAPAKSLVIGFYDPRMNALARDASADASGDAWADAIDKIGFTHVQLRPAQAQVGLMPALQSLGFEPLSTEGEAQLWTKPGADPAACLSGTIAPRDEARRLMRAGS